MFPYSIVGAISKPTAPAPVIFLDNFNDANGTELNSHDVDIPSSGSRNWRGFRLSDIDRRLHIQTIQPSLTLRIHHLLELASNI